jgi:lipopolysaccharide/colanic/teichoic acid biosynthesis glycosyltransferase
MALVALMVRLTSPGPALSPEARRQDGRVFVMLKFRSMRVDAEAERARSGRGRAISASRRSDGSFAHRLDELPQLWNVVVGDMRSDRVPSDGLCAS